jgi:hypothetical protein
VANRYLAIMIFMSLLLFFATDQAFADPLKNASRQRIGNYDVQLATDPKSPVTGSPVHIQIRIAGVNGDDLINIPIQMRIVDSKGTVLQYTSPLVVPAGHYIHEYTFSEPGRYVVYVDLKDSSYSGEILTFTFFVSVAGPFDYLYVIIPVVVAVAGAGAGAAVFLKKRKIKTDLR